MTYFENSGNGEAVSSGSDVPASYSKRIGAAVVDILITVLAWMPTMIFGVIGFVDGVKEVESVEKSTGLNLTDGEEGEIFWEVARGSWAIAAILGLVTLIWSIWYFGYWQGKTGLTPGKRVAGTKLINIETGTPPGGAKGLGRSIIPSILGSFSSGIYQLIDYLWPLWDDKNQRITDKMFSTQVVLNQSFKGAQGVSSESGVTDRNDSVSVFDQGPLGDDPIIS
ncbi:MAG: hypothetical protein CL512_02820 [Actinobacteria bacterium]|nr:hypothetical protein [Actinomycetota bacterium]|tara:strand:+ start:942 stop:1613 length:672 start_codon:yes stop_codon:yes gene_type:complete